MSEELPSNSAPRAVESTIAFPIVVKKLLIWGFFLGLVYLARDFFFVGFMTFLFSYLVLSVVGRMMGWLSPHAERNWLRRLLTLGVFLFVPITLVIVGGLVGPSVVAQGHRIAAWLGHTSLDAEVARMLEPYVGPYEFKRKYRGPDDKAYQTDLETFRKSGVSHVSEYNDFSSLENWMERGFSDQFSESERARIRQHLAQEGTSSAAFEGWFVNVKHPRLLAAAPSKQGSTDVPADVIASLERGAATAGPRPLLEQIQREPAVLSSLRQEWMDETVKREVAQSKRSPAYHEAFRTYYDAERARRPDLVPYTFDEYVALQNARSRGRQEFGATLERLRPSLAQDQNANVEADFKAAKQHELFQDWWSNEGAAKFLRAQLNTVVIGEGEARLRRALTSLVNVPLDLGTALLLSFFICIDFPKLRSAVRGLRGTWLRDVYDEIVPALAMLGTLIGRSLHAQGLIALCNALVLLVAFKLLGVEHEYFLSAAVFVLCLVPTLGAILAWVLIVGFTLFQPGGGPLLAFKASGAVALVLLLESFVLSPRILGQMMETHPVLIIAILPLAQSFFGVWGLILATPVAVYVIYVVILRRGLPGSERTLGRTEG